MEMKFGPRRVAGKLTYANVVATLALMIAISGGTALAATHLITGRQIAKGTISAANIKHRTLTANLFKRGTLRRGATGATGPAGPAGPAGAPGAAGTAAAYGVISTNGSGNPTFNPTLSKGFTSVYSPSAGVLCIAYPAGITTNLPLSVNEAGSEPDNWEQVSPAQCSGTGFEVANLNGATNLSGDLTILAP